MDTIEEAIKTLLTATEKLRVEHPSKIRRFTLDGRLVGDIGEVIAFIHFDIILYDNLEPEYDGHFSDDKTRKVQIKATMKESLTFPPQGVPDYYLGLKIDTNGKHSTIYNGPGRDIKDYLDSHRKTPKTGLHNISNTILKKINDQIDDDNRIPERRNVNSK